MDKNLEIYVAAAMDSQVHRNGIFTKRRWWQFW